MQMLDQDEPSLLLDTHVWIWLNNGSSELSKDAVRKIDRAATKAKLYIAAISVWEVATLVAKNRVLLRTSLHQWVDESLSQPGIEVVALSPEISIESTLLPGGFHGDPADRIIVATARIKRLMLLTRDNSILQYDKKKYVAAIQV